MKKRPAKYVGPKRTRVSWPPQQASTMERALRSGEPLVKALQRFDGDKSLRANWFQGCCACGFRHLLTFEVFRQPQGDIEYWLIIRAHGDEDTRPKSVVKTIVAKARDRSWGKQK